MVAAAILYFGKMVIISSQVDMQIGIKFGVTVHLEMDHSTEVDIFPKIKVSAS